MSYTASIVFTASPPTLTATIGKDGAPYWSQAVSYPALPPGDPAAAPTPDNPAALFRALIGNVAAAMADCGYADSDPDPDVATFAAIDKGAVLTFQGALLEAAAELYGVGQQLAARKGRGYDPDRIRGAWKRARLRPQQAKKRGA